MGMMGGADGSPYDLAGEAATRLGIAPAAAELATLASDHDMGDAELGALAVTFDYLAEKRRRASTGTLPGLSRLPRREPKAFDGFDFSRTRGRDAGALAKLPALADLYARRNVAFIGPGGIGKTHLAQAYGRECCMRGPETYYVKASEPGDRPRRAAERGSAQRAVATLARPSCLIVDEAGRRAFDRACTDLFFDVIDRRHEKKGPTRLPSRATWPRTPGTSSSPGTTRCSARSTGSSTGPRSS
jgi:DNA replication protein DnaC